MGIANVFRRPFPLASASRARVVSAFAFGSFVFLFLLVFTPFGLDELGAKIWTVSFGYGAITTAAMIFLYFVVRPSLPQFYNESTWTVAKEIINTLGAIFLVTLGNVVYSAQMGFFELSFQTVLIFLGFTLAVGAFPITLQVLIRQNQLQQKYDTGSETINIGIEKIHPKKASQTLTLKDEDGKEAITCDAAQILTLESADNYVKIFVSDSDELKMVMVRNALSNYEQEFLAFAHLFRVHRTYIVNLDKIDHVSGNARGYTLKLSGMNKEIPVARRRTDAFDRAMAAR